MKKLSCLVSIILIISMVLAACGSKGQQKEEKISDNTKTEVKEPEYIGDNLKYNINSIVNDGKNIELVIWTDEETEPFYKAASDSYMNLHKNVKIKIAVQPWSDYWTKLPLALNAGKGPDIYRAHQSHISNLKQNTYPLPESIFPIEELKADFPEVENLKVDGNLYSVPLGIMNGGGIYYNKDMWAEAGLTDNDIPKTWDEFIEVGKKLTKKDDSGNITQYGFSVDHAFEYFLVALNYQKGEPLFKEDQYTWNFDNETTYKNIDMIKTFKNDHGFMMYSDGDCEDQMGNGQVAMIYQWSWLSGYLNSEYPDLNYGFFMMPTEDGNVPPAYDSKEYEWLMSVSSKDEAKRAVAFDFMKYYLADNDNYLNHAMRIGVIPSKNIDLSSDPRIEKFPNMAVTAEHSDRLVYYGIIPTQGAKGKALRSVGSVIFINEKDPSKTIKAFQQKLMEDTKRNDIQYKAQEDQYKYYSEFNK